jgi:hypothetical protein
MYLEYTKMLPRITAEDQQLLVADIVNCLSRGVVSRAELAYDVLFAQSGVHEARAGVDTLECLTDLAEQLKAVAKAVRRES